MRVGQCEAQGGLGHEGCLPFYSGPSQPKRRRRHINSLRLMSLGMGRYFSINAVNDWQLLPELKTEQPPVFQGALQLFATGLQRIALGP